jgi:hypothetical protein
MKRNCLWKNVIWIVYRVKRREAEKDIDGILSRLKPVRPKKADLQSEVVRAFDFIRKLMK